VSEKVSSKTDKSKVSVTCDVNGKSIAWARHAEDVGHRYYACLASTSVVDTQSMVVSRGTVSLQCRSTWRTGNRARLMRAVRCVMTKCLPWLRRISRTNSSWGTAGGVVDSSPAVVLEEDRMKVTQSLRLQAKSRIADNQNRHPGQRIVEQAAGTVPSTRRRRQNDLCGS